MRRLGKAPLFAGAMALLLCLAALQAVLPRRVRSDMENRSLAQVAAPTMGTVLSGAWMRDMESFVADQFPGRDRWMHLQALWDAALLRVERNGILLGKAGWLFERADHLTLRTAEQSVQAVAEIAGHADAPVTLLLVPLSSAVHEAYLPAAYRPDDQAVVLSALYDMAGVACIDILAAMEAEAAHQSLYYRTDHHWTMDGARLAYGALAEAWSLPAAEQRIENVAAEGFYGTYFARAPSPLIQGDSISFDVPAGIELLVEGEAEPALLDPAQWQARDKYAALLWGNHGHITLTGGDPSGGTLLVIKDSYANALLPLLAQHFARIEAVDPRYYGGDLPTLLDEMEADRILCLYGLTTLLTDRNLILHAAAFEG